MEEQQQEAVQAGPKFDKKTLGKINSLVRKEKKALKVKVVLYVVVPALLTTLLLLVTPAWAGNRTAFAFVWTFLVVCVFFGIFFVIIRKILKQANPMPFNKQITPDTDVRGLVYEHHVLTVTTGRRAEKGAYVKAIVPDINYFMYSVVPVSETFEIGETVDIKYDSKSFKTSKPPYTCIVRKIPDFSKMKKTEADDYGLSGEGALLD